MIWHPLTWAFWVAVISGGLLYGVAFIRALNVFLNWNPARADAAQLRRERHAETATLLGHWAFGGLMAAAALGLAGIALAWHRMTPGAMCGTGVLQAWGTDGTRAMIFWGVALSIFYGWRVLDRIDSHYPEGILTQTGARTLLSVAPFLILAVFYSWQALMRIEAVPPVSCCAAVYDRVLSTPSTSHVMQRLVDILPWGSLVTGVVLLVMATLALCDPGRGSAVLFIVISVLWASGTVIAVKQVGSAYFYQVLTHPCLWCLFLPNYYGAGFFIFGGVAMVVVQSLTLWLCDRTRLRYPTLSPAAGICLRRSARWIIISLIGVGLLTLGPALAWRLRTGIWLDGMP